MLGRHKGRLCSSLDVKIEGKFLNLRFRIQKVTKGGDSQGPRPF